MTRKMLILFFISCFCINGMGQGMQVRCDSVIEIKGQAARLIGKEMKTGKIVYFIYGWKGGFKRPDERYFLNEWFTLYYPEYKMGRSKRKIYVTKNK